MTAVMATTLIETALEDAGIAVAVILDPGWGARAVLGHANAPFAQLFRQPRSELEGMPIAALKRFMSVPSHWTAFQAALAAQKSIELELALQVGGKEGWLGLRLTFPQHAGGPPRAVLTGREITDKRQAAQQLDRSRRLMAGIFSRISVAVAVMQANGQIMMVNPAFQTLLGYTMEEVLALRMENLFQPGDIDRLRAARARQMIDGQSYDMCLPVIANGNTPVPIQLTSMLMQDGDRPMRVITMVPFNKSLAQWPSESVAVAHEKGELRAVSLGAFQALVGDGWERVATRAMMKADQIIRRRLRPDDVVSRVGDNSFVLWFDRIDPVQNAEVLARIVREIRLCFLTDFAEEVAAHISPTGPQTQVHATGRRELAGYNAKAMPTANAFQDMMSTRQRAR